MQIEIYNMIPVGENISISLEAVCDSFSSLLWDVEFYQCGSFEVYMLIHRMWRFFNWAELLAEMMIIITSA